MKTRIESMVAQVEQAIDDLCRARVPEITAASVVDHICQNMPPYRMKTEEIPTWHELLIEMADKALAKRFDPLCQGLTAEELLKHADALEAFAAKKFGRGAKRGKAGAS